MAWSKGREARAGSFENSMVYKEGRGGEREGGVVVEKGGKAGGREGGREGGS